MVDSFTDPDFFLYISVTFLLPNLISGLELIWRLSRIVINKVLDDNQFDYKLLRPIVEQCLKEYKEDGEKSDEDEEDNSISMTSLLEHSFAQSTECRFFAKHLML